MEHLTFNIGPGQTIEAELNDYLVFVGATHRIKQQFIDAICKIGQTPNLKENEINYFGENFILKIDDKQYQRKNCSVVNLNYYTKCSEVFSYKKGSMIYDWFDHLAHSVKLNEQIEIVNDQLLQVEILINSYLQVLSDMIKINFDFLNISEMMKYIFNLQIEMDDKQFDFDLYPLKYLYKEVLNILKWHTEHIGTMIFLVLDLETYPTINSNVKDFVYGLLEIAQKSQLIKIFIFDNGSFGSQYPWEMANTIVVSETMQQLPDTAMFYLSIQRHYPDKLDMDPLELQKSFFTICRFIGKDIKYSGINEKNMILLLVVKELLGDYTKIETSIDNLTPAERSYLQCKIS